MDEAMLKSGQFPNVAIMAGSDPKEVMREYGQTDTEHMDNGVCVHMCPYDTGAHSNVSQNLSDTREDMLCVDHEGNVTLCKIPDTRELLEADVRSEYYGGIESEADEIIGWLDRQAAITRRECADERENLLTEAIATCTKKISKLEAERDALKEQINRFNVPKSEENAENGTSKGVLNTFDVQNDTREQLEADVRDVVTILLMAASGGFEGSTGNVMKNAKVLLDMPKERALDSEVFLALADMVERERAELTAERDEWRTKCETREFAYKQADAERKRYSKQIDSLIAERDILKERVARFDSISSIDGIANLLVQFEDLTAEREKLLAKVDELTAERDQLSRDLTAEHALVVQFEHDNEKIKADLKTANDTINTLRASVAGLKETVEKLKAHETA